jgi:SPP1 family phage portal protein
MTIEQLLANIDSPDILIQEIKRCRTLYERKAYAEYKPELHKVMNRAHRPDKIVMKPDPLCILDANGNPRLISTVEKVSRIAIPLQKLIVNRAASFLTGGKVSLQAQTETDTQKNLLKVVQTTWSDNKLQFKNNVIAKTVKSELECCEIWYSKKNIDGKISLKCNIYKPSDGYTLYPIWDDNRDLIAFGIHYKVKDIEGKEVERLDLYTDKKLIKYSFMTAGWNKIEDIPLVYGKIPVIYYCTDRSEWQDVQTAIDRLEKLISNFGDTNDYNGSPILFVKGSIRGFASKGESGKVLEGDGDNVDAKYITWEHAPEAIKLEIDTLFNIVYTCTQTPNISFDQMKGLGDISGVAFDRIMIDAHLKAKEWQDGAFGESIQRRVNFMKAAHIELDGSLKEAADMEIVPLFSMFKIDDETDRIENAMKANGGLPIISHKESINMAALTTNPDKTFEAIKEQGMPITPIGIGG